MKLLVVVALTFLTGCMTAAPYDSIRTRSVVLMDASRGREIPLELYLPLQHQDCTRANPCPVAFLSQGYGLGHTEYSFIARALADAGYFVAAIQHDLPSDPAISRAGDLFANRTPMWRRGAQNLRFVRDSLSRAHPELDWTRLVLVGHSNGGDLSALALRESPALATTLVTLDNRRYPLPRDHSIKVLSIRGSDFPADPGVLPVAEEVDSGVCITTIASSRHNDMTDHGPAALKSRIGTLVLRFLKGGGCVPEVQL